MGTEISNGKFENNYPVSFLFSVGNQTYFYGHSKENKNWVIHKLGATDGISESKSSGSFQDYFDISLPFSIKGKTFFCTHNLDTNCWSIHEMVQGPRFYSRQNDRHKQSNETKTNTTTLSVIIFHNDLCTRVDSYKNLHFMIVENDCYFFNI